MSNTSIRISRGTIVDPSSPFNGKTVDLLIEDGIITSISEEVSSQNVDIEVPAENCFILPGMLDMRCQLKDPGYEHQEDIISGTDAASFSGFTALAVHPTTLPITQNKSQIDYLLKRSEEVVQDLLPIGATTEDLTSDDITEMFDLRRAGAVGFSNGDKTYPSSGALMRALMYSKEFGGLIMSHAVDEKLAQNASVNESETTIHTGLRQQPDLSETSQIKKEIDIAAYADAAIHFSHISSGKSVAIIREARQMGLKVTCDVSIWHLIFNDSAVLEYDTNYKVTPPFRTEEDRKQLLAGLLDGTIDAIVSDHNPQNIENKLVEFDYAAYGINGLQSFYSIYNQHLSDDIPLEKFVELTAITPRKLLGQEPINLAVGEPANLWVANPKREWIFNKQTNCSRSENNPMFGQHLVGKCDFVVNKAAYVNYQSS
ncbi:MAG: dihydroorotase [Bacteroidia bacterium]|nr:dihydroorotase [Bacteroidia bacterium]